MRKRMLQMAVVLLAIGAAGTLAGCEELVYDDGEYEVDTVPVTETVKETETETETETEQETTEAVEAVTEEYTYEYVADDDVTAYESGDWSEVASEEETVTLEYTFRNDTYMEQHFEKHGDEFGYTTVYEYVEGANRVIEDPNALTKTEAEDGDYIYYLEDTNEFVIVSTDGYIRTYFKPSAGIDYYNRQ